MKKYEPTGLVKLTKGFVALVDNCDLPWISQHTWYSSARKFYTYAKRTSKVIGPKNYRDAISLHTEVWKRRMGRKQKPRHHIHHKNGNTLDNRYDNLVELPAHLHLALKSGNIKKNLPKGVYPSHKNSRLPYMAKISINGKAFFLGTFAHAALAQKAYLDKWHEIYGKQLKPYNL